MLNLNFQNGQAPALNARNMDAIVESINTLGYAVGGPNVASTVSAMTDTSKVYVYTGSETGYTAGNWYYYNGSAWVSGGVYQAAAVETDTTLTMPGEPADAKATGDAVADLKSAINTIVSTNQFGNMMGMEKDPYYPVDIMPGGVITISTSDGSVFPTNSTLTIYLYDANKTQTDYFSLKNGQSYRTIKTNSSKARTKFLRWDSVYSVPLMVNAGDVAMPYTEYIAPIASRLNDDKKAIEGLENTNIDGYRHITKWANGSYSTTGGLKITDTTTRVRPTNWIQVKKGDIIIVSNGTIYEHGVGIVSGTPTNYTVIRNDNSWYTSDETIKIQNDGYFIVTFANASNMSATIDPLVFDGNVVISSYAMRFVQIAEQNGGQINGLRLGEIDGYRHIQPFVNGTWTNQSSDTPTLKDVSTRIRPIDFITVKSGDVVYINNGTGFVHVRAVWKGGMGSAELIAVDSNWNPNDRTVLINNDGFVMVAFADATDQTANVNPADFNGSVRVTSYAMRTKKDYGHGNKFCVMSYNVQWFYGRNANTIMQNAILDKYNPDIIGLQEFRDNVSDIPIWTTLFKNYSYTNYTTSGNTNYKGLASKVPFGTVQAVAFATQGTETKGYSKTYLDIDGKSVCWVNAHVDNDETVKVAQCHELFEVVQNETYFILTADMNTDYCFSTEDEEYTTIMKQFIDAGYHSANCSEQHGFLGTYCGAPTIPEYNDGVMRPDDHIITSANITINSVFADATKAMPIFLDTNNIDHFPLVAYITIN